MRIVALDPGETTGWAVYNTSYILQPPVPSGYNRWQFSEQEYTGGHIEPEKTDHHNQLYNFLCMQLCRGLIILYEAYEGHSEIVETITAEYVGVIKLLGARKGNGGGVQLVRQRPQVQEFWDDDKLKKLGVWIPGRRHAMSATRHLLHYQVFTQNREDILWKLR